MQDIKRYDFRLGLGVKGILSFTVHMLKFWFLRLRIGTLDYSHYLYNVFNLLI